MKKPQKSKSIWKTAAICAAAGIGFTLLISLLAAMIVSKLENPLDYTKYGGFASIFIGSAMSALIAGTLYRSDAMKCALLSGGFFTAALLLISLMTKGDDVSITERLIPLIIICVSTLAAAISAQKSASGRKNLHHRLKRR